MCVYIYLYKNNFIGASSCCFVGFSVRCIGGGDGDDDGGVCVCVFVRAMQFYININSVFLPKSNFIRRSLFTLYATV